MDNLWPEMFGDVVMKSLATTLDLKSPAAARADFVALGQKIRAIIDTTPSKFARGPDDIPLSWRARWLHRHVLKPSALLQEALADDPKFAEYPENHRTSLTVEERQQIAASLQRLDAFARDLHDDLDYRAKQHNLRHNIEMRREFIFWIAQVVKARKRRSQTAILYWS